MLQSERHRSILREVELRGTMSTNLLAEALGVSDMTIRRDLSELSERGLLIKVHGGASSLASSYEPAFTDKALQNREEKEAIAALAASYVRPGQTLAFSAGSTCALVAQECLAIPELTVITNSLQVSELFYQSSSQAEVLLIGGKRTPSDAFVGPLADLCLNSLSADLLFIGSHGASPEKGLMTPNLQEATTNQALIRCARTRIAVFDHTKFSLTGLSAFAGWDKIDTLITSSLAKPIIQDQFQDIPSEVVYAS